MGVNLRQLISRKQIELSDLSGKTLAVDSFNIIFQFLTTIRSPDGQLFTDSKGNVTSHLLGLFSRTTHLMKLGIKLAFVFDGEPPELKRHEIQRRAEVKKEAHELYKEAAKKEDLELMKKYAARTAKLTDNMIDDAKKLLTLLGQPVIQAPSEGEAQAAQLVKEKLAWGVASQDYDSLLYGTERLVQNLSIAGRRKKAGTLGTVVVEPELIMLKENLTELGLTQDQFIVLAMLVGTDYNQGGIKGIGPKKALEFVKKYKTDFEKLFNDVKWNDFFKCLWKEVFDTFKKMPVEKVGKLKWEEVKEKELVQFLVGERDFSRERVEKTIKQLKEETNKREQKGLAAFS